MIEPGLPRDQDARDAIRGRLNARLFVEAGAGTGKTTELVARVVALVLGRAVGQAPVPLRSLATITFTEAAAAELRDRIRREFEQVAADAATGEAERRRCDAALNELDLAAIETLHGFAHRILATYPLEAGLPPRFEVLDDLAASLRAEQRWGAFLDDLLSADIGNGDVEDALLLGMELKGLRKLEERLKDNWDRLEFVAAAPAPPVEAMGQGQLTFDAMLAATSPRAAVPDLSGIIGLLEEAADARPSCGERSDGLAMHVDEIVIPYLGRLRRAADAPAPERILALLANVKLTTGVGQAPNWRGVRPADIRELLKRASAVRDALILQLRAAAIAPLVGRVRRYVLAEAGLRRDEGLLTFHDLLVLCRDLLRDDVHVRGALSARFTHILLDEFQDTDPLQWEIANLLIAAGEPGALFLVGDPKQSIYRFRRADIEAYLAVRSRRDTELLDLTENFRSTPAIIAWVNRVFRRLLGEGGEGRVAFVPLTPGRVVGGAGTRPRLIGGERDGRIGAVRELEAAAVAATISEAWGRWEVGDASGRQPARARDITILIPRRTALPALEAALEAAGIPYRVESRSLLYETQEVRDLLNILGAIDDPTDEVAVAGALRSPAFACTDEDLAGHALGGGRWNPLQLPPEAPGEGPVVAGLRRLSAYWGVRPWRPVNELVESVVRELRLMELAYAHRRPRERWARLRFVIDQARAFADARGGGLRQFVEWMWLQADQGTRVRETVAPEDDDDAVRILTIHGAKGLEFPIVVLAGLNAARDSNVLPSVLWDSDGQIHWRVGSANARFECEEFEAVAADERSQERDEEIRLLYVGATRARDHLVVSLYHKSRDESLASRLAGATLSDMEVATALSDVVRGDIAAPAPVSIAAVASVVETAAEREAWLAERTALLAGSRQRDAVAATEIARRAREAAGEDEAAEREPWRRGRAGTAVGRAVHAVLQTVDLATGDGIAAAARAQAMAEGVPGREDEVASLARAVISAPAVREAAASGRFWRELYVAAPLGEVLVEGFVDLLYEGSGGLVVVDYKTDAVTNEREADEAVERYRLQGAAYALGIERTVGKPVTAVRFVFARAAGPVERALPDLRGAIAAVERAVQAEAHQT